MISYKIVNKTSNENQFNKYKPLIEETCEYFIKAFDIDAELEIQFTKFKENKIKDFTSGQIHYYKKKYYIQINSTYFKDYKKYNASLNIDSTLYHELVHLYDMHNTAKNYLNFSPYSSKQRSQRNFIINIGFGFWTEFFAYYCEFKSYKKYLSSRITLLKMLKQYKELKEKFKNVVIPPKTSTQLNYVSDFRQNLSTFLYTSAKFLAMDIVLGYNYRYCEKTRNDTDYKELVDFYKNITDLLEKMFYKKYSKWQMKRLWNIGCCILYHIYQPFDIDVVKNKYYYDFGHIYGQE